MIVLVGGGIIGERMRTKLEERQDAQHEAERHLYWAEHAVFDGCLHRMTSEGYERARTDVPAFPPYKSTAPYLSVKDETSGISFVHGPLTPAGVGCSSLRHRQACSTTTFGT